MAGERPICGVDSDGQGGLWIVYRDPTADFYDLADVRVVHLDAARNKLSEWLYQDEYAVPSGLAFTDNAVWVSYGFGHDHVRKLDPATGATLATFATEGQIVDLAAGAKNELLLASEQNQVIAIDDTTGGEIGRSHIAGPYITSTQRGVAYVDNQLWVVSWMTDDVYMAALNGTIVKTASTDVQRGHVAAENVYVAWDGAQLIIATKSQIWWFGER
jgi:outer membrane protein assembly factor BamB